MANKALEQENVNLLFCSGFLRPFPVVMHRYSADAVFSFYVAILYTAITISHEDTIEGIFAIVIDDSAVSFKRQKPPIQPLFIDKVRMCL